MAQEHRYRTELRWQGSTAGGYRGYSRDHQVVTPPVPAPLAVSSDPAFRGRAELANPEQLLLAAASSCQLLSFLALAARNGIDVLRYDDHAEAVMPVTREPMRITRITLRPHVEVAAGADLDAVEDLVHRAHLECFIANSLAVEISIEPTLSAAPV